MKTRKVQVTGGSTYTVSIPKEWANSNDVSAGSIVEFFPQNETLVLTPREQHQRTEGEFDVAATTAEYVERGVIAMYLNGFDDITFDVSQLDTTHRRVVKKTAHDLIGLEIVTETQSEIRMRNLLDASELSVPDSVQRMRLLALEMLDDAVRGLLDGDADRVESVVMRDDDLDRMWYLVSRVFRRVLHDPAAVNEIALDRESCFNYRSTARQLERVGDHAVKIAENAQAVDEVPAAIATDLTALCTDVRTIVGGAVDTVTADAPDGTTSQANRLRDSVDECQQTVRRLENDLWDLDSELAQPLSLVVDSLSRAADYGGNITEIALQQAAPKPAP